MNENDPRRGLDPFTAAIVEKMRVELEIAVKKLACSDGDMALAQVDRLHERALYRLKNWDFEIDALFSGLPEDEVVKVIGVTIAAIEQTFDVCREHIRETDQAFYGNDGSDDPPE